jgi:signal transduction histidine kinase
LIPFRYLILSVIICYGLMLTAKCQSAILLNDGFTQSTFENRMALYKDTSSSLSPQEVFSLASFSILSSKTQNQGYDNLPVWGTFRLANQTSQPKSLILQFRKSFLDSLLLYRHDAGNFELIGKYNWRQNYLIRPYPDISPTFELELAPNSTATYLFKIQKNSGSWHIVPTIFDKKYYQGVYAENRKLQSGIFLGIFMLGIFFVLSFYILSGLKIFLYYALYQAFFIIFYFTATEFFSYFFNGYLPSIFIGEFAFSHYQLLTILIYATFTVYFFEIHKLKNHFILKSYHIFKIILIFTLVVSIVFNDTLVPLKEFQIYQICLNLVLLFFVISCIFYGYIKQIRGTLSYFLAQTPIFLSLIFWSGANFGMFSKSQNFTLIFGLAFLTENVFMLSAMALLLRQFFKEKEKKFTSEIVIALETERNQIAMNLHDELGGSLSTIKRKMEDLMKYPNRSSSQQKELEKIFEMVDFTNHSLRRISHNLAPAEFESLGLINSLKHLCNSANTLNLKVLFYSSGKIKKLNNNTELNLYRIVSEALHNIIKHSGATEVEVSINFYENELNLIIADNGKWKESNNVGIGLKNIQLRVTYLNGLFNIDTSLGGTQLTIEINNI